jgi:LAO/AO transport system kinase
VVLAALNELGLPPRAVTIGITGTPGAGKSSLIASTTAHILRNDEQLSIAVLAVDPSSSVSFGSLLGDRTRMTVDDEQRFFFRSQASRLDLGGLSRVTYSVCRLLTRLFDLVMIETVGVGQSEIDVCAVADFTAVVMAPLGGDHVQWMKAGIMEKPDILVLNKCDQGDAARRAWHSLRSALGIAQPGPRPTPSIIRTSTVSGEGIDAFADWVTSRPVPDDQSSRSAFFLRRWVQDEYGRSGLRRATGSPSWPEWQNRAAVDFEAAQLAITAEMS